MFHIGIGLMRIRIQHFWSVRIGWNIKSCRPTCAFCSAMADKKRYKALKSLETKDTKGVHFITAEELKVRNRLGTFGLVWFGTLLGGGKGGLKILA
jgi:hypothetical protein